MKQSILRSLLLGLLLGISGVLTLSLTSSSAAGCPAQDDPKAVEACSSAFLLTNSGLSAVAGHTEAANRTAIDNSWVPAAGKVAYADMVYMEDQALGLLTTNKTFRADISPFQGAQPFEKLVFGFDTSGGFGAPFEGMNLQGRLDLADQQLRQARDLYAFLAVYAIGSYETRFRSDLGAACGPALEDVVADTMDRCNFAARMRQSIREAAYLRMIFGQQFTADALGLNFSANMVGGEAMVRKEITKLEDAVKQFQLAKDVVSEGMQIGLGNGCFVYDFYTDKEWALLFRAVEGMQNAQHQIAIRKSYLGGEGNGPAAAHVALQTAASVHYVQLVGGAGLWAGQHSAQCASSNTARMDNNLVAEMVANQLAATEEAHGLREGRNPFGFDVRFTPARPYHTAAGTTDLGLWEQAMGAALEARTIQGQVESAGREFDLNKQQLMNAILDVKGRYFNRLGALTPCRLEDVGNNPEAALACAEATAAKLELCRTDSSDAEFAACIAQVPTGLLRESWDRLRTAHLRIRRAQASINAISQRASVEMVRNATVNDALLTRGIEQSTTDYINAVLEGSSMSLGIPSGITVSFNPNSPLIGLLRSSSTMRQAMSTIDINSKNSEAEIRVLLIEVAELHIDLQVAAQEFNAQLAAYLTLAAETKDLVVETRRAVNYNINNNPANDPSFRLVRDGLRLDLASNLSRAARLSYLAARRAEYEYAKSISGLPCSTDRFLMTKIYQARTANDIISFLNCLNEVTTSLPAGVTQSETTPELFTLSIAKHVLGLTDQSLGLTGDAARQERLKRFRAWVAQHTVIGDNGKPVLIFHFSTSLADGGIFANVTQEGFPTMWLQKMAGLGAPWPANSGFSVNVLTTQTGNSGLVYRNIFVTQGGLLHMRAQNGCILDYRLIHPAALLGLEWPDTLSPEQVTAQFRANVNLPIGNKDATSTPAFFGRPVSASDWQVEIRAGSPDGVLDDMDLQQLFDIELTFSTTRASTVAALNPKPADCVQGGF